ncbi:MAG TPA: fibronectin type III domain-containing protein [Candidatus Limnocylindrales bacterium]|nr:fibronectin type III domain-containing protein [Candidatus Limnocylindrales bacterium]
MKRPFTSVLSVLLCLAAASVARAAEPENPTNLRSDKITDSQVRLTWRDRSNNEDGFEIFRLRQGSDDFQSRGTVGPDVEEFFDTFDSDHVYIYQVVAFNDDGESDESNECFVNRNPPLRPTDVEARLIALYVVRVSWFDRSTGEGGFAIQRAAEGESFKTIAIVDENTEVYDDDTLSPAQTYTYRVRALGRPNRCIGHSRPSEERTVTTKGGVRILTVELSGVGRGTVRSEPEGMHCGPKERVCFAEFPLDKEVTLFADSTENSDFRTWIGPQHCEESDRRRCTIHMTADKTVGAVFRRDRD